MCECPFCGFDLGEDQAWVECPVCGALVHQKISKTGRVKKVILHRLGNGREKSDKTCPYCGVTLEKGVSPVLFCPECRRIFMELTEALKHLEELEEFYLVDRDHLEKLKRFHLVNGDHHLLCLSLKGRSQAP